MSLTNALGKDLLDKILPMSKHLDVLLEVETTSRLTLLLSQLSLATWEVMASTEVSAITEQYYNVNWEWSGEEW